MALALNPDVIDGYESKNLAQMRALVFNALGFLDPLLFTKPRTLAELRQAILSALGFLDPLNFSTSRTLFQIRHSVLTRMSFIDPLSITPRTLGQIRNAIVNRMGLALALASNVDSYANIFNDVYNALGYAGQATPPPGVAPLLATWIGQAQDTLWARIEMDKSTGIPPPLAPGGNSVLDSTAIRLLAIAYGKAHDGSPDAGGWMQQVEKYLSDLTQRLSPDLIGQINAAVIDAHATVYRRFELGLIGTGVALTFGASLVTGGDYTLLTADNNPSQVDDNLVELLALAALKEKVGQPDAKAMLAQYEQSFVDLFKRAPPNAIGQANAAIIRAHTTVYHRFELGLSGTVTVTFGAAITATGDYSQLLSDPDVSQVDDNAVELLALAEMKEKNGHPDAKGYLTQYEQAMADLLKRSPPNILQIVTNALTSANETIFRRYVVGNYGTTAHSQTAYSTKDRFLYDSDLPSVDDQAVYLLALAKLEQKYNIASYKQTRMDFETDMDDLFRRRPPNAIPLVNQLLKNVQLQLYRAYRLFRIERWYTWTLNAGQRFYGTFGDDDALSTAPTNGHCTLGGAVVAHSMSIERFVPMAVALNTGRILVVGGIRTSKSNTPVAELFDPTTGVFTLTGPMASGRRYAGFSLLKDGRVFISGGNNGGNLSTFEIYDPVAGTFTYAYLVSARGFHQQVTLQDGNVLIVGGTDAASAYLQTAELYNTAKGTIGNTTGSLPVGRTSFTATLLADGRVLIVGGTGSSGTPLASCYLYNPLTQTFTLTGALVAARASHTATLMADGTVLVAGGASGAPLATAEIYDPLAGTFSAAGAMVAPRFLHGAILLKNQKVLLAGNGFSDNTAELYDPATNTFAATAGAMALGVQLFGIARMTNQKILIAGGSGVGGATNTAQIYDPDTNLFSFTGSLTQGTAFYQLTSFTANGESLPGPEFFLAGVPANTAVFVYWTIPQDQPFVIAFGIYGRALGGAKQLIAKVPANVSSYIDTGTIPAAGVLPIINQTAGPGALDPRAITWMGISQDNVSWRPLVVGIPPTTFNNNQQGIPQFCEIRQSVELWPTPAMSGWKLRIKGYFKPFVFEADDDMTSLDWEALLFSTVAEAKATFKRLDGRPLFDQLDIADAVAKADEYLGNLTAGTHMGHRFIPGEPVRRNEVQPILLPGPNS